MNRKIVIAIVVAIVIVISAGVLVSQKRSKIGIAQTSNQIQQQIQKSDLVWYEVPELGIKFKVTPEEKVDLKYITYKTNDGVTQDQFQSVSFYSKFEYGFNSFCKIDSGKPNCFSFILNRRNEELLNKSAIKLDNPVPLCVKKVIKIGSDIICYFPSTTSDFTNDAEYQKYLDLISNKHFILFIDSMESL